jgi:hypothetical protein
MTTKVRSGPRRPDRRSPALGRAGDGAWKAAQRDRAIEFLHRQGRSAHLGQPGDRDVKPAQAVEVQQHDLGTAPSSVDSLPGGFGPRHKDVQHAKGIPLEFRHDVVAVARKGEAPLSQVPRDFAISESCLHRSLKLADIDDDVRPAVTSGESGACCWSAVRTAINWLWHQRAPMRQRPKLRPTA